MRTVRPRADEFGIELQLHSYARGGHGFGMRSQNLPSDTWIDRFIDWHAALA